MPWQNMMESVAGPATLDKRDAWHPGTKVARSQSVIMRAWIHAPVRFKVVVQGQ